MYKYNVGSTYMTQEGALVKVLSRTDLKGYECLECSDGRYRYDRSTHSSDAGRCTGTGDVQSIISKGLKGEEAFLSSYNYPHNFERYGHRWDMVQW